MHLTYISRHPGRDPRAFTLIELLVVISIISLLISILLPALSHARKAGMTTVAQSNLRQLAVCAQMYANDYDEWTPIWFQQVPPVYGYFAPTGIGTWAIAIRDYLNYGKSSPGARFNTDMTQSGILHSPHVDPPLHDFSVPHFSHSNYKQDLWAGAGELTGLKVYDIVNPSEKAFLADVQYNIQWWNLDNRFIHHSEDKLRYDGGGTNHVFFDGHVEFWNIETVDANGRYPWRITAHSP